MTSAALVLCCSLSALAACQTGPVSFDAPAGRLDEALQALAHRTGCPVMVSANLSRLRARAVRGSFTPTEALWNTLKGSGLEGHLVPGGLAVDRQDQLNVLTEVFRLTRQVQWAVHDGALSAADGKQRVSQLNQVARSVQGVVRAQGFVSAAEQASYQRTFTDVKRGWNR